MRRLSALVALVVFACLLLPSAGFAARGGSVVTGLGWWVRPQFDKTVVKPRAHVVLSWGVTIDTTPAGVSGGWWLENTFREYVWQATPPHWRYLQSFHSQMLAPAQPASATIRKQKGVKPFYAPRKPGRYEVRLRVVDPLGGDTIRGTARLQVRR